MDPKLKAKLADAIKAFLAGDGVQVSLSLGTVETYLDFYAFLHKRMLNLGTWRSLAAALARERIDQILAEAISKSRRAEAHDPLQLPLFAEFEHLPRRIRAGKASLPFERATVAQFLAYKARYEKRSETDQLVVQELRRLAGAIESFAAEEPGITVAAALERAAQPKPWAQAGVA